MEVHGKVHSLAVDETTNSCLAVTVLNGAHTFFMKDNFYGDNLFSGMSASGVEGYPYATFGNDPLVSGCFVGDGQSIAVGSAAGCVTTVSRRSRGISSSLVITLPRSGGPADSDSEGRGLPVRSLAVLPGPGNHVLACTEVTTAVADVERGVTLYHLVTPVSRSVAAVPLSATCFATANYDGKVLLYDTRDSLKPSVVLSIPDQITCLGVSPDSGEVCAGTVAGRVFTLRCAEGLMREQAFGTGKKRAPIRSVAMYGNRIVAGDISGKLSILDASDVPNSTKYWTADTLLNDSAVGRADDANEVSPVSDTVARWESTEVTAVTLAKGIAWAAFSRPDSDSTQVVALPA